MARQSPPFHSSFAISVGKRKAMKAPKLALKVQAPDEVRTNGIEGVAETERRANRRIGGQGPPRSGVGVGFH
jgi:hypothetical protein